MNQTEAGTSFATWLADRRTLTPEEIADIATQLQKLTEIPAATAPTPGVPQARTPSAGISAARVLMPQQWAGPEGTFQLLPPSIKTTDIKPTTKFGQEFQTWVAKRDALSATEIKELTSKITTLTQTVAAAQLAAAKPAVPPELIIARTPYPKWWKTLNTAKIELTDAGTQVIVPAPGLFTLFIATIVLTVSAETNISFTFGVFGSSGALDLGGTDEPRGIVVAMGDSPAACGKGAFSITSNGSGAAVGGFVTYYLEKET